LPFTQFFINPQEREYKEKHSDRDYESFFSEGPLYLTTTVVTDENGKRKITGLASLIGQFDDSRLRFCKICSRVFWAKKSNAETCSKRCADSLGNLKRLNEAEKQKEKSENHFQSRNKK
jgi:hypothetical protein